VDGFVLRNDLLLAQARGNTDTPLKNYCREIEVCIDTLSLDRAFDIFLRLRAHIMLVVTEYGVTVGVLTLEDLLETLIGLEIVDEGDKNVDMRSLAHRLWKRRSRKMGLDIVDL
jgi:CBS domain containing-hemolysin-like protein